MLRSNQLDGIRRAHSDTNSLRMEKSYYENIFGGINEIIVVICNRAATLSLSSSEGEDVASAQSLPFFRETPIKLL